ncbi:VpaChn25_0724 family phage protein [Bradyrhizobium manausense]
MGKDIIREHARLIILRELHGQANYSSNDSMLQQVLESFGIAKSRDWIRGELDWLADMDTLTRASAGTVWIVTLASKGVEFVERRLVIEGIKRPGAPEG